MGMELEAETGINFEKKRVDIEDSSKSPPKDWNGIEMKQKWK